MKNVAHSFFSADDGNDDEVFGSDDYYMILVRKYLLSPLMQCWAEIFFGNRVILKVKKQ